MSEIEALPGAVAAAGAETPPELSVVVTLYDEVGSLDELHRRAVATLEAFGRPFEIVYVDDGSTDGTFAALERLHAADARVRAIRFKRNFGQHPAMHAGLSRARGEIVVTMDGDLQNLPEDIPKLVAAVDAGYDVASGRRAVRNDSWGRTLPSRLINGMLRRFTHVDISDFGCAFNAYRRDVVTPMLGSIGRQKFTKALILSGGASVIEVDVGHARAAGGIAVFAAAADAARAPRPGGLLAAADPVGRSRPRVRLHPRGDRARCLRGRLLDQRVELPGAAAPRGRGDLRARGAGVRPRARRRVPGPHPARGRGPAAVRDRPRAVRDAMEKHIAPLTARCLLPRCARILKPGTYGSL